MITEENMPKLPPNQKWIPGYAGLYSITRKGDVFSYSLSTPVKLSHFPSGAKGYPSVNIYKPKPYDESVIDYNKSKQHVVANLVLRTYGPKPPSPKHSRVLYKDENVKNIDISNLAWTTQADIARKSINRIKKTMNHKHKRTIIAVINGYNNASQILGSSMGAWIDTGRPLKNDVLVFTSSGYEQWLLEQSVGSTTTHYRNRE